MAAWISPTPLFLLSGHAKAAATDRRTANHALLCADLTGAARVQRRDAEPMGSVSSTAWGLGAG